MNLLSPELDFTDDFLAGADGFPLSQEATEALVMAACAGVDAFVSPVTFPNPNCITFGLRMATNDEVQTLNRDFRQKDKPTNVLSFPTDADIQDDDECYLGDIIMAAGVLMEEADALGIPLAEHLQHLVVHGILHIMGYDHIVEEEAKQMMAIEIDILQRIGVQNPYE